MSLLIKHFQNTNIEISLFHNKQKRNKHNIEYTGPLFPDTIDDPLNNLDSANCAMTPTEKLIDKKKNYKRKRTLSYEEDEYLLNYRMNKWKEFNKRFIAK